MFRSMNVDAYRVLVGHGRVVVTDTHTRHVKGHRIRVLAEVNPQPAIRRQRGARATLADPTWIDERWCVQAREHPNTKVQRRTDERCEPVRPHEDLQPATSRATVAMMSCPR